ncbi:unnamed protein product, partial [Medioppia subpectinata]
MLDFRDKVREYQSHATKSMGSLWTGHPLGPPIVVHCSAGIGRTETGVQTEPLFNEKEEQMTDSFFVEIIWSVGFQLVSQFILVCVDQTFFFAVFFGFGNHCLFWCLILIVAGIGESTLESIACSSSALALMSVLDPVKSSSFFCSSNHFRWSLCGSKSSSAVPPIGYTLEKDSNN